MLTLWKPAHTDPYRNLFDSVMDRAFDGSRRTVTFESMSPNVDIEDLEDKVMMYADLPGMGEEDIKITVEENTLSISGKREIERKDLTRSERRSGAFERRFYLGDQINQEGIEAKFDKGVLTVVLPKADKVLPKEIPIKVG